MKTKLNWNKTTIEKSRNLSERFIFINPNSDFLTTRHSPLNPHLFLGSFILFSWKADGNSFGINFTNKGIRTLPPGNKKMVRLGIVLQTSNNCSFTFVFSSGERSLRVDWPNSNTNSPLSSSSCTRRSLLRIINNFTVEADCL